MQRAKLDGGLVIPNFKLYFISFTLGPLTSWFDPLSINSWRALEEDRVSPWRLQDIVYANISIKQCQLQFGSLITQVMHSSRIMQKLCSINCTWHLNSQIFNNKQLVIGNRPNKFTQWEEQGIHVLSDIYNNDGLRSFQDLKDSYNLPGTSFFFYLQLRASLKAHGVPWKQPLEQHPLHTIFELRGSSRGIASTLYLKLLKSSYRKLSVDSQWRKDVQYLHPDFDWQSV